MGRNSRIVIRNVVFFGCGVVGRGTLEDWLRYGIAPEFFCDNNNQLWGESILGVPVRAPEILKEKKSIYVIITMGQKESIYEQLKLMGIENEKISDIGYPLYAKNLNQIAHSVRLDRITDGDMERNRVLLDMSCGMVLGGVEQWCYQTAQRWKKMSYCGEYLIPFMTPVTIRDDIFQTTVIGDTATDADAKIAVFRAALKKFIRQKNSIVLCNFPFEIFQAACFAKRSGNAEIKILAIIHNDEGLYYQIYGIWKDEIDCCIVLSRRMKQKAISAGIPEQKIKLMGWYMNFPKLERRYSDNEEPLRIGYAGRITRIQKRVDIFEQLLVGMRKRKIRFLFQIAGSGDYEGELTEWIKENGNGEVIYCGMIPHEEIYDFWNNQDVYISASEWEGHSISQTEAMAMGAVPVVTNTSGTEDDITDGENGFIVDVGDIDCMLNRLEQLYLDRVCLQRMGVAAGKTIREKCDEKKAEIFWKDIAGIAADRILLSGIALEME